MDASGSNKGNFVSTIRFRLYNAVIGLLFEYNVTWKNTQPSQTAVKMITAATMVCLICDADS